VVAADHSRCPSTNVRHLASRRRREPIIARQPLFEKVAMHGYHPPIHGAENCNSSLAVQANRGTASDQLRMMQVFSDQQSAHHILNFFAQRDVMLTESF